MQLIDTLYEACRELKKQKDNKFQSLCGEIQEFSENIYLFAGEILGQEHEIIKLLEDFYKKIYLVSVNELTVKHLSEVVHKISAYIKNTVPDRFEIAFFCYKASMSDCLESIYFAAKNDPNCDAYFIPIPYYDKNPDGSFAKMYFEGVGCYSDKYELTDWRKYNVKERRPDVIFIMNPYDEANHVTSIHPDFYSSRLKKYTDCLIHVDYGMNLWAYKNPKALEDTVNLKGTIVPAQYNSDYCIVYQDEIAEVIRIAFRQSADYMKYYGMDKKTIDTKVCVFGSPKFDKVLNSKKDDFVLPDEWKDKIKGKKVVLYNTSLSGLLDNTTKQFKEEGNYLVKDDRYFNKLKNIISAFKDRDDVVLWWRPHPLFESTLKSMRPEFYNFYISIVKEYIKENQGIFDKTEDLHRAIYFSDGMISDRSSLLWLYLATGKPFYIPNVPNKEIKLISHEGPYFHTPIQSRIVNMRSAKGANVFNSKFCVWWGNFHEYDYYRNMKYENYEKRFIHYIVNPDEYPERLEYEILQKQIFHDFIVNSDGTAGEKIYEFAKQKIYENNLK